MKELFAPYKESLELKELGFNEPCLGRYQEDDNLIQYYTSPYIIDKNINRTNFFTLAPLYQQAFDWIRNTYRLHSTIDIGVKGFYYTYRYYYDSINNVYDIEPYTDKLIFFDTYEKARLACLKKLIEICKNN